MFVFLSTACALLMNLTSLSLSLLLLRFTHLTTLAVVFHPTRQHLWVLLHLSPLQQVLGQLVPW